MTDHCKQIIETLGCECLLFENETDGDKIISSYKSLISEGKTKGFTPLIIVADDRLAEMLEDNFEDSSPAKYVYNTQIKDSYSFFAERRDYYSDMLDDADSDEIPENCIGGIDTFSTHMDIISKKVCDEIIIAKIPTDKPWELALWFPMGGWNDCPLPEEQAAVFKYWYEEYGAYPAIVTGDTWELYVEKPVKDRRTAAQLANEMYLFCTDIVDQGVGSISALAETLLDSSVWFFWWD